MKAFKILITMAKMHVDKISSIVLSYKNRIGYLLLYLIVILILLY